MNNNFVNIENGIDFYCSIVRIKAVVKIYLVSVSFRETQINVKQTIESSVYLFLTIQSVSNHHRLYKWKSRCKKPSFPVKTEQLIRAV